MLPEKIPGANCNLGAPRGWNEQAHGECVTIEARRYGNVFETLWRPSPDEVATLLNGGTVKLSVFGQGFPPVKLEVEP